MKRKFALEQQLDEMDCGVVCLSMICNFFGKSFSIDYLKELSNTGRRGVSLKGIIGAANTLGFETLALKVFFTQEEDEPPPFTSLSLPCILHWKNNHFVVLYKISESYAWVADPAEGKIKLKHSEFLHYWRSFSNSFGIALQLQPKEGFYSLSSNKKNIDLSFLLPYFKQERSSILKILFIAFLGIIISASIPFSMQYIIDVGIKQRNYSMLYLILIGQLVSIIGQSILQLIQSKLLLKVGNGINISLVSKFLKKLMNLPITFFNTRVIGDLLRRIDDHKRIELLLTSSALNIVFSSMFFLFLSSVLIWYSLLYYAVFIFFSIFQIAWIVLFLKRRKKIDYEVFEQLSGNQSNLIETIQGIRDIKLQNSESKRHNIWLELQQKIYSVKLKSLYLSFYQDAGGSFLIQAKNLLILWLCSDAVIKNSITIGAMMSIQYIIGQLNAPLGQFVNFIRTAQDAKISLERLNEVYAYEDEIQHDVHSIMPSHEDLSITNVSFQYTTDSEPVLDRLTLLFPKNSFTAIVGESGSGKTTIVKLLLGLVKPTEGDIFVGNAALNALNTKEWRKICGAVMQDGFIFSDTIENNICDGGKEPINRGEMIVASTVSNLHQDIEKMPLKYNTVIGPRGEDLSQGQKQRLLIARAIYKKPNFLFLDEATNALDSLNESTIVQNLKKIFTDRTIIAVAHRLSTIRNADKIVVLDKGKVIETGTHDQLVSQKGKYYDLFKAQLDQV